MFSSNNPQFACTEFRKLSNDWEFEQAISSPRYPQSSGKVDNAWPQTCRTLMKKVVLSKTDIYLALFAFRNTPSERVNVSPTLKLFSGRTTTDSETFNSACDLTWKRDGRSRKNKRKQDEITIPLLMCPSTFECWWNETSWWRKMVLWNLHKTGWSTILQSVVW